MGKLLLSFTVFWAYIAFSQYFLIWYANIPEETEFYVVRNTESWNTWAIVLEVACHFFVTFALLCPRAAKTNPKRLAMHLPAGCCSCTRATGISSSTRSCIEKGVRPLTMIMDLAALVAIGCPLAFVFIQTLGTPFALRGARPAPARIPAPGELTPFPSAFPLPTSAFPTWPPCPSLPPNTSNPRGCSPLAACSSGARGCCCSWGCWRTCIIGWRRRDPFHGRRRHARAGAPENPARTATPRTTSTCTTAGLVQEGRGTGARAHRRGDGA